MDITSQYEIASWAERLIAIIFDLVVLWLVAYFLPATWIYYDLLPGTFINVWFEDLSYIEQSLAAPLYFVLFRYYWQGQTIGKKILRLSTVSKSGDELKLWEAIVDCVGYFFWPIDFILGICFSPYGDQWLTQLISDTVVIKQKLD